MERTRARAPKPGRLPLHAAAARDTSSAGQLRALQHAAGNRATTAALTGAHVPVVGVYETMPTPGYDYQSWLLRLHIATYRALPRLSGMLVWNLKDFGVAPTFAGGSISSVVPDIHIERGLNTKGLFDYAGRPKPAVAAVRAAFAPLN